MRQTFELEPISRVVIGARCGIIISLAFWSAVWGIPGMFLSVPIMVMLLVVCSHIPALRPVAILLSREGLPDNETLASK